MTSRGTTFHALRGRRNTKFRALVYFLIFSLATPSYAVSLSQLKGYQGFQAAALAIAMVNKAMQEASKNPMDTWRRQNVAHAMGLLPIAIRALAMEFQSNKLHDDDLKFVTGILGGFVDMSAPDKFQKFLKNPDQSLIPQLGANFPQDILRQAEKQGSQQSKSIVFDETAKGSEPTLALNSPSVPAGSQELANLNAALLSGKSGKSRGKTATSKSISFNEDAPKNPSGSEASAVSEEQGTSAKAGVPSNFESDLARDIASVESQLGLKTVVRPIAAPEKSKNSFSEDFFDSKKQSQKPTSKRDPENYVSKIRPKYWKVVPLLMLLVKDAGAEAAAAAPTGSQGNNPASTCKSCQGGGGQGGGGGAGGGGGGSGGADFLFGLAAIMAATSPMVAAAMQADADKDIAKTNAAAAEKQAQMAADNAKYMAEKQAEIAQQQTQLAQQINKTNNDAQTQRLDMQLNEMKAARDQSYQSEMARRDEERKLNDEKIALAQRQADDQLKLSQASFNAQLTQAGLSTGFTTAARPGGNLVVDNSPTAGRPPTQGSTSVSPNAFGSSFANSNMTGPSLTAKPATATSQTGTLTASTGGTGSAATRGIASTKLVTSATNSKALPEEDEEQDPKNPNAKKKKTTPTKVSTQTTKAVNATYRGAYTVSNRTGTVAANGGSGTTIAYSDMAIGSTRGFKSTVTTTSPSSETDLAKFAGQATSNNGGFAAWKSTQVPVGVEVEQATARGVSPRTTESPRGSSAYNAGDLGSHGGGLQEIY